jgi:hypothetical protein
VINLGQAAANVRADNSLKTGAILLAQQRLAQ